MSDSNGFRIPRLRLTNLLPEKWDCFASRIARHWTGTAWRERQGIKTRPAAGLDAINYVDPTNFFTRDESIYFAAVTEALFAMGYDNSTLAAIPFDWRMHPSELPGFVSFFQNTVESAVSAANGQPAVLLAHSMGNPMTHYFLTRMSASCK